ncbi:unnamed protein product, partial [Callosobruchus maculatus]
MIHNVHRKKTKKPNQKYTEADIEKAFEAIENGMSQRKAAWQ